MIGHVPGLLCVTVPRGWVLVLQTHPSGTGFAPWREKIGDVERSGESGDGGSRWSPCMAVLSADWPRHSLYSTVGSRPMGRPGRVPFNMPTSNPTVRILYRSPTERPSQ